MRYSLGVEDARLWDFIVKIQKEYEAVVADLKLSGVTCYGTLVKKYQPRLLNAVHPMEYGQTVRLKVSPFERQEMQKAFEAVPWPDKKGFFIKHVPRLVNPDGPPTVPAVPVAPPNPPAPPAPPVTPPGPRPRPRIPMPEEKDVNGMTVDERIVYIDGMVRTDL